MLAPPIERELKFRCESLDALVARLRALSAVPVTKRGLEDNVIFDKKGELAAQGALLRLRRDAHGVRLTFKGPAHFEGGVKLRPEHEALVGSNPEAAVAILLALGFTAVRRYQQRREEWDLGGVAVALDETPLGGYAEFEGDGAEAAARRCGFDPAMSERRDYLALWDDHRRAHPQAPADMVFA
jgi:predicted adenylyl cyclase CyaB